MIKRKTKRNAGRSRVLNGFRICKNPTVHLAGNRLLPGVDCIDVTHANGQPFLFAVARDARTIFASWTIDWRSIFEKAPPAARQVHLRVIAGDATVETTVAVEPTNPMHYVTISGLHTAYRVEIGYFQPFDRWNSVATSSEIEMPSRGGVEAADGHLATIPFHVSFQQLTNLFGTTNGTPIAKVVSEFQTRVSNSGAPSEPTAFDIQILNRLNVSLDEIAVAQRDFRKIDSEKLARQARAMFQVGASSPVQGFQANPGL